MSTCSRAARRPPGHIRASLGATVPDGACCARNCTSPTGLRPTASCYRGACFGAGRRQLSWLKGFTGVIRPRPALAGRRRCVRSPATGSSVGGPGRAANPPPTHTGPQPPRSDETRSAAPRRRRGQPPRRAAEITARDLRWRDTFAQNTKQRDIIRTVGGGAGLLAGHVEVHAVVQQPVPNLNTIIYTYIL